MVVLPLEGVRAQKSESPLPLEVLLSAPTFAPAMAPVFSPDGALLAYTVTDNRRTSGLGEERSHRLGAPSYALGTDVWVVGLPGGTSRNLTSRLGNNWAPSWSPDGHRLAFLSDRPGAGSLGATHVWIWNRVSGTLRQASDIPVMDPWVRLGRLEWLGDNRTVLVKGKPLSASPATYASAGRNGTTQVASAAHRNGTSVRIFRFDPSAPDTASRSRPTNLDDLVGALGLVDVETGSVQWVTSTGRICAYALSPNRRVIAWTVAAGFERPGAHQILMDLMAHDLITRQTRRLQSQIPLEDGYPNFPQFSWSPASDAIVYRTNGAGTRDEIHLIRLDGKGSIRLADGPVLERALQNGHPLWDSEGAHVYFLREGALWRASAHGGGGHPLARAPNRRLWLIEQGAGQLWTPDSGRSTIVFTLNVRSKRAGLARVSLSTGQITQLVEGERWYPLNPATPPAVTPRADAIAFLAEDPQHPPDLWMAHARTTLRVTQVTQIAPELKPLAGGDAKMIQWRSLNGDTVNGALIYPVGYRAGVRYPLIVKVYGGTDVSDDINRFGFAPAPIENLRIFTARGYAVLLAESRLYEGTPALDLTGSVIPGLDKAVELGVADPERIGVIGHSYGGYSTLVLITSSRRFRAAVMRAGFGDLVAAYGELSADGANYMVPWAEHGQGRMGGTPWDVRERYVENSPIFYLDRVSAPLLIVQGGDDSAFLADEVFTGLRRLGKRVEYARYAGEGHWEGDWTRPNQIDYLHRVIGWFDRHLKGDSTLSQGGAPTRPQQQ